jgi:predicted transcriptional regulator
MNSNELEKGAFAMDTPKVFESEYRFCLILWENEPVKSSKLVELCKEQLGWKPTTTYTVIKRLSERGVLKNENTVVTSLVSKDQVQAAELNEMVEKTFEGSLPAFIAAFTKHQKISDAEIDAVQQMIDRYRKGESK